MLKKKLYKNYRLIRIHCNYELNAVNDHYCMHSQKIEKIVEKEIKEDVKQSKKPSKKKKWLNFLYFALNIAVVIVFMAIQLSKEDDVSESLSAILDVNWWFILLAFSCFAVGMLLEQIRVAVLIHKATGVYRSNLAYKVAALGRHYDNVTPLATGGQPFQVLYMNKYGIKAGEGISIAMGKYIYHQIVYFVLISIFLFYNLFANPTSMIGGNVAGGVATTFYWIGYVIQAVVIFLITFISFNKRAGTGFVVGILKLLSKIKIGKFRLIKDYNKTFQKVMGTVNLWQNTTKKYNKSFLIVFVCVLCSILYFFVSYSMPFFIYSAFEGWHPEMWLQIVTYAIMIDLASAFNPIPMGTGTADLSFGAFFATLFIGSGSKIWALLIWRFLLYYIYVLQGTGIIIYDALIGNKRLEKNKEFWMHPIRERIRIKREEKLLNKNKTK